MNFGKFFLKLLHGEIESVSRVVARLDLYIVFAGDLYIGLFQIDFLRFQNRVPDVIRIYVQFEILNGLFTEPDFQETT